MDRWIYDVKAPTCSYTDWQSSISCGYWTSAQLLLCTNTTWLLNVMMLLWNLSSDLQASVRLICTVALKVKTHQHVRLQKRWDSVLVCNWTEPESLWTVWCCCEMLLCFDLQGHRRPESCDTDGLITCSVLKWEKDLMLQQLDEWGRLSLHILWCCQLWSSFTSCRHEHNNNSRLHFISNTRSQQASGSSDWLTVPPLSLSVQSWSLSPFSSHSFTEENRKYWIFTLILTVFITILLKPARTDSNSLLTS